MVFPHPHYTRLSYKNQLIYTLEFCTQYFTKSVASSSILWYNSRKGYFLGEKGG